MRTIKWYSGIFKIRMNVLKLLLIDKGYADINEDGFFVATVYSIDKGIGFNYKSEWNTITAKFNYNFMEELINTTNLSKYY